MSFLPRDWLWSVVPLLRFDDERIDSYSSFLEQKKQSGQFPANTIIGAATLIRYNGYNHLVTCKHVVDSGGRNLCAVLRNKVPAEGIMFSFLSDIHASRNTTWVSDASTDLAVTLFSLNEKADAMLIPQDLFCSRTNLTEGWNIYYFGYPVSSISTDLLPVVRGGLIALVNHPQKHRILVDAMVAGGNSGGPAFLTPMPLTITGGKPVPSATPFIGIVSQTFEASVELTPFDRLKYVAGISMLISTDAIVEILASKEYEKHFAALVGQ